MLSPQKISARPMHAVQHAVQQQQQSIQISSGVLGLHHPETDWLIVLIKKTILIIKVTFNFYKYQYLTKIHQHFIKSGC